MRFMPFAAGAFILALSAPAVAQTSQTAPATSPTVALGSVIPTDVMRDLPLGDTVYSILENTQSEVISDRFNSGGLNIGGDTRAGGFLGSMTQTLFRVGDIDVSDPAGSGSSLLFPNTVFWQNIVIATGLMPMDINTPGLAVTLEPRRAGTGWTRTFSGSGSGGSLAAGAPANQAPPITRLGEYAHGSAMVDGPLSARASLVAGGTWSRGASYRRERLASTESTSTSAFAHVVFAPSASREWRVLGWLQRSELPFENWQAFRADTARTQNTAVHVQATLESKPVGAAQWRVFGGFTQRERANDIPAPVIQMDRIPDGPVQQLVDSTADTTARRLSLGARLAPLADGDARHRLAYGVNLDRASTETSNIFAGTVRETVNAIPARIWSYAASGAKSLRNTTTLAAFASDVITLSPAASLDAGIRGEVVHGGADGAAVAVNWMSLLPHAYLKWRFSERRALTVGYARSANSLNQTWLAFGDPAAPVASVAAAFAPNVIVSRVGPGTAGNASFSAIASELKRPYTDELVIGWERRRSASTRYTLTGIARRQGNLLGVVNTGISDASYATIGVPDANQNLEDPIDDRILRVYNRLPSSFGRDTYLVTNPDQEAATAFALRMSLERTTDRMFLLFGATASAAYGSGGNRGYGPLENDQDVPGELFTNPNGASYARGRLFTDRAFTIKWTTMYRFPGDLTVGGIARYQDGQPFSRLAVVPDLNQGAEGVQAFPNAGSRYTFTGTFDLRVQKGLHVGRSRLDVVLDAYNLFTRSSEVEEYVVSGPGFRTPTAIQPPHSVHLGLRLTF